MKPATILPFLAAYLCGVASATTISINFTDAGSVDSTMLSTDIAGVAGTHTRVDNWNNVPGGNGTTPGLIYSDGSASGASVQVSGSIGNWRITPLAPTGGDDRMWKGYTDFDGNTGTISITGLSLSGTYDVYVYFDGDNGSNWRVATYTLGSSSFSAEDSENTNWGAGQNTGKVYQHPVAGTGGNQTWPVSPNNNEGNYIVFTGVSGSSFDLLVQGTGGSTGTRRAPVNGIQIVQIPEPSATVLAAVSGLFAFRRRRR